MIILKNIDSFAGLPLNDSSKGATGFYETHLRSLYAIFILAKSRFVKPLVAHFIIDDPLDNALRRLTEELARWSKDSTPLYFSVKETRPKGRREHLHVAVLFDSCGNNYYQLMLLEDRLRSLSNTRSAKLALRKSNYRKDLIDMSTGEQLFTSSGLPAKRGSKYYHSLVHEFEEAFMRFSYLCKAFSKSEIQKRGVSFSHSRINRNSLSISDCTPASDPGVIAQQRLTVFSPQTRLERRCRRTAVVHRQDRRTSPRLSSLTLSCLGT